MELNFRDFYPRGADKEQVLLMYDCPRGCKKRRAFFDNGEEWIPKPHLCPKCGNELKSKDRATKYKIITVESCLQCEYKNRDELELTHKKEQAEDKNFVLDRKRFCLTNEEGEKFREELARWEEMGKLVDELKEKEKDKELYDKAAKLKKLTTVDLEKVLAPALEKSGYIKFQFSSPEIGKGAIIPFSAHDSKSERADRGSTYDLKRLIKKTLQDTNWRLMTDGVTYRLGFLSGRLRGYENEEDLIKLVRIQRKVSHSLSQNQN